MDTQLDDLRVWAIVLNYRTADLTLRCLKSLRGEVSKAFVVDNSDLRPEADTLRRALETAGDGEYPATELAVAPRNLGFAAGVNFALRRIGEDCTHVLLINSDALATSRLVGRLLAASGPARSPRIVAPRVAGDAAPSKLWYQRVLGLITRRRLPGSFPYLSGTCLLIPKSLAQEELFDERFFMYGEDVELAWRMRRRGIAMVVAAGASVTHLGNASAPRGGDFYEYHTALAHLLLVRAISTSKLESVAMTTGRALVLPLRALVRSIRSASTVPLRALARAWRDAASSAG